MTCEFGTVVNMHCSFKYVVLSDVFMKWLLEGNKFILMNKMQDIFNEKLYKKFMLKSYHTWTLKWSYAVGI
jgi:hypothetical protein